MRRGNERPLRLRRAGRLFIVRWRLLMLLLMLLLPHGLRLRQLRRLGVLHAAAPHLRLHTEPRVQQANDLVRRRR